MASRALIKCASPNVKKQHRLFKIVAFSISFAICAAGCSFQPYIAKPVDQTATINRLELKNPSNAEFNQYLLNNGYETDRLPIKEWGLNELTYCALFFHPSLEVARAQWRAAQLAESSAAERTTPTINGNIAHSDDQDPTKKPFAFGLSIDIPIETANKRDIRIENAQHLSQTAKLEIAQTAWQLRSKLVQVFSEYQYNQTQLRFLNEEALRKQEIVSILQKRVSLGEANNVELSNAKLQLQITNAAANTAQQNTLVLYAKLASSIGLPLPVLKTMPLSSENSRLYIDLPNADLQSAALLNRLDIRIALERYALAESKLKLEIAKQYPDLVISPGAAYEFGDHIWSLGISSLLTLLNKNKVNIEQATQLREVEAAQIEALQSQVILDASIANAEVKQAKDVLENQKNLLIYQELNTKRMQARLAAGEIDRLDMTYAKLENMNAEKNVALAQYQLNQAINQLENVLQRPLADKTFAIINRQIKTEGAQ